MDEINLAQLLDPAFPDEKAEALVADYCKIDLANLEIALSRQASLYAYTVAAFEMSKVDEARKKWQLEAAEGEVYEALMRSSEKMTVAAANKITPKAAPVKEAQEAIFKAQGVSARLKALVSGLEHRKDMLIQISARQRQEMAS